MRVGMWAFVIGALIQLPATIFALLSNVGERILPFITPGIVLLWPLTPVTQQWPGAVIVALAALANGLVYASVALVGATVAARLRQE